MDLAERCFTQPQSVFKLNEMYKKNPYFSKSHNLLKYIIIVLLFYFYFIYYFILQQNSRLCLCKSACIFKKKNKKIKKP